jgi:O-antigen/teichoic acid export membrane protein
MGFNALMLRVFDRVRYLVAVDLIAAVINIAAAVLLIQQFGAVGAAIATTATFIFQNVAY